MLRPKAEEELKQIAKDIYAGNIFTSNHMKPEDQGIMQLVFLPLTFIDGQEREDLLAAAKNEQIGCFYERYTEALPRQINGYPIFMSMSALNKEDVKKVEEYIKKVGELMEQL
jgi:hypothetical protein